MLNQQMSKWTFILMLIPVLTTAQVDNRRLVDSLKYVTDMPYMCESEEPYANGCGSEVFWKTVQQKEVIIPFLIGKISDSTTTKAYVPNLGGQYAVGDIAYFALTEIIDGIPTFELLGVEFDKQGCGFCSYWNYVREDIKNRRRFERSVRKWYKDNKSRLIWVPNGQPFTGHHNGGMYTLRQ
jgi:hypothetical protein